ncbi:hypothetical protein K7X08_013717 [Anisodus acutangulus]|uniref:RING-type E3 ubiquitin transferase n=1 Tax=Anisodus acutangulus TaxID=402998 RepID=A0A9Q1LNG6_9SOLA|nr:hypothetical protein K7X08_013717 [Anisodus acutangulus]
MAMRPIRKLFPTSNQTADCHNVCDSTCPYGCYPYPDMDYYMPLSAPLPQQPPIQSSNINVQNVSPYIFISIALLASLFLLLSYYLIIVRNCSNWNRRRAPRTESEGVNEEFLDENRGPIIDHPIWYINTVGLQPSLINLITIVKYKTGDGLIDGTECSVCLNEFQDDDSLRLLPKCNHAFHIHCIDAWLRSHTNCPLCRTPIISNTAAAPVRSMGPISSTNTSHNEDIGSQRDVIVEVNRDEELQENASRVTGDQDGFQEIERPKTSKKEVKFKRGDKDVDVQQMRRSVSMDSSIGASIGLQMVVLSKGEGEKSFETKRKEEEGSNSRIQRVMDSASSMKRSLSYGGRSFFSKNNQNPSSVLPL